MKTRSIFTILFVILSTYTACAQTVITLPLQGLRGGDTIFKRQVEFKDPGRRGTDVLWDFSKLKSINEKYKVRYYTPIAKRGGDSTSVTCLEHRTMYKYVSKGDSLLLMGFENAGSKLTFEYPQYMMHFPFILGDSISSIFKGSGSHEHTVSTGVDGRLTVVADAMGTLILPDGDTLYDVLRVRSVHDYKQRAELIANERRRKTLIQKDSVLFVEFANAPQIVADSIGSTDKTESTNDKRIGKLKDALGKAGKARQKRFTTGPDSIYFRIETCRWYAPGYRYPLFETIHNFSRMSKRDVTEKRDIATAFYFPPSLHTYLDNDSMNKEILDSLKVLRVRMQPSQKDALRFNYNLYPNPVRTDLNVELLLDLPSKVRLTICSMSGVTELSHDFGTVAAGQQTLTQSLNRLNPGYYVLHILVDDQIVQVLILKQ